MGEGLELEVVLRELPVSEEEANGRELARLRVTVDEQRGWRVYGELVDAATRPELAYVIEFPPDYSEGMVERIRERLGRMERCR